MTKILTIKEVIEVTALGKSSIYSYISENRFPRPIKIGKQRNGWILSEIENWLNARVKERDEGENDGK